MLIVFVILRKFIIILNVVTVVGRKVTGTFVVEVFVLVVMIFRW